MEPKDHARRWLQGVVLIPCRDSLFMEPRRNQ